jgi:Na+-translocating ferredoxin:NAD+ oxidoreductase subunit G
MIEKKDIKDIFVNSFKLMFIMILSVSILSFVNSFTYEKIEQNNLEKMNDGLYKIFNIADKFRLIEDKYYVAYLDDKIIGYIVYTQSKGYNDIIEMLVGFRVSGEIEKVIILKQNETPGIGDQIFEPRYLDQFINYKIIESDMSDIDSITGATVSSNAVKKGVIKAYDIFKLIVKEENQNYE